MNFYPSQLRAIAAYCEALDNAERDIDDEEVPHLKYSPVTDRDGTHLGVLRNDGGLGWSWEPAGK